MMHCGIYASDLHTRIFAATHDIHTFFFWTMSYQIPLSDWLTNGPYETVRTTRVLNTHTKSFENMFYIGHLNCSKAIAK